MRAETEKTTHSFEHRRTAIKTVNFRSPVRFCRVERLSVRAGTEKTTHSFEIRRIAFNSD